MKNAKSNTLKFYSAWVERASQSEFDFVDMVYEECERHYSAGGDMVVECLSPTNILEEFTSLSGVKEYCGLLVDRALDCRWGEDCDLELLRKENYDKW